jgi:nucleoside-diphosphate-sugar epimerase
VKRILITGGAGFVGRHFTKRLLENGHSVVVVDNLIQGSGGIHPDSWPLFSPKDFKNFMFVYQDCRDFFVQNSSEYFDYIFHLAAVVGGRLTIERNPLAVAADLAIDADMWNWAKSAKPGKVVNFSSSAAYPIKYQTSSEDAVFLSEDLIDFSGDLGRPDLTYGWAKLTSEYLGHIAFKNYGIKSVSYRPFSGYGPDQDLSYPFPSICLRALESKRESSFTVWGSGKQSRDFIHIEDCVSGVLATMDKIDDGSALNLSTRRLTSFIEFATIAMSLLGYNIPVQGNSQMPEGVASRGGDTEKQSKLGFEAQIQFETGIEEALNYFLSLDKRV